jgi:hypothetical protein
VPAECGMAVPMSDLFGVDGAALLDRVGLPAAYRARSASPRRVSPHRRPFSARPQPAPRGAGVQALRPLHGRDPDDRLTLHVALKLRRLLDVPQRGADTGEHRGRDQRRR